MCMLIWHPSDAEPFTRGDFEDFHRINRNGFGVIWKTPRGDVRWKRGLLTAGQSWQLYQILRYNGCTAMGLHWRMATSGDRFSEANCHPVKVNRNVLLMHNGARIGPSTATESDTVVFARGPLASRLKEDPTILQNGAWLKRLESHIGSGNKLLIWDQREEAPVIVGERRGLWWKGRWYSNTYAWTVPKNAQPKNDGIFDWDSYSHRHANR